jgi:hypothetical protein
MKTKESILRKHLGKELFKDMSEWLIFPQPSGSFPMIDLIYLAMEELIYEDRKNVADYALVRCKHFTNELSTKVAYPHCDGWEIKVDKDSIINAPNLKLR